MESEGRILEGYRGEKKMEREQGRRGVQGVKARGICPSRINITS